MADYLLFKEDSETYSLKIQGSLEELYEAFNKLGIELDKSKVDMLSSDEEYEVFKYFDDKKPSEEEIEFDLMVRRLVFNSCRKDNVTKIKYLTEVNYINTTAELAYEKKGAKGKYEFIKNLLKRFPEYIKYLTEQPEDLQKFLIAADWRNLRYIDDPSDELIALAKSANPKAALLVNETKYYK